jgi:uncharacterized protein
VFWGPYAWLLIPGFLLAMWAQWKVRSTFERFSQVPAASGMTGAQVARELLARAGADIAVENLSPAAAQSLRAVQVESTAGSLSDHYDPGARILRLSEPVYNSSSLAALGVAAHETGHALQHATGYGALVMRTTLVPVANVGSKLSYPIIILAMFLGGLSSHPTQIGALFLNIGIILFLAAVIFTLVTLPVEYNASRRAIALLQEGGFIRSDEVGPTKAVLDAAGLTYLAAAISAILSLLQLLLIRGSRD